MQIATRRFFLVVFSGLSILTFVIITFLKSSKVTTRIEQKISFRGWWLNNFSLLTKCINKTGIFATRESTKSLCSWFTIENHHHFLINYCWERESLQSYLTGNVPKIWKVSFVWVSYMLQAILRAVYVVLVSNNIGTWSESKEVLKIKFYRATFHCQCVVCKHTHP